MSDRGIKIYMFALDAAAGKPTAVESLWFDPPLTAEEREYYDKLYAEITAENARAKAEGRQIFWDIPFDP